MAIKRRRIFICLCALILAIVIAIIGVVVSLVVKSLKTKDDKKHDNVNSSKATSSSYEPSTATVVNMGDMMVHSTQLDGARISSDGTYDFSAFYKYVSPYFKKADLAVANLEVTFGSTQSGKYSGYPAFNTPDILADNLWDSGIRLLLTANNHCYDTGLFGLKRTVNIVKEKGFSFTGTRESADQPTYTVNNVNGIKIGSVCYTYENKCDVAGRKSINGAVISTEANDLINSFSYNNIDSFYENAKNTISEMKKDGAEFIVFYMHWGEEYQLKQNVWQDTISQKLCNLGVDLIIGGHPHVIQPIKYLTSEDSQNNTVCVYSMGNAISNQRQELMSPECTTGHTEDGMLFYYTVERDSKGNVALTSVDIIPTWVNKYRGGSGYLYTIVPLENENFGIQNYGLTGTEAAKSQKSYIRTKTIVSAGLTECQKALGCKLTFE